MDFAELIAGMPAEVQKVANQLREIIRDELPTASEAIPSGVSAPQVVYWVDQPSNVICTILPGSKGCQINIHYIEANDSEVFNIEGTEPGSRTISFSQNLDPDETDELTRLIHLAGKRAEGLEI